MIIYTMLSFHNNPSYRLLHIIGLNCHQCNWT